MKSEILSSVRCRFLFGLLWDPDWHSGKDVERSIGTVPGQGGAGGREGASEGSLHPRRAQGAHFPILQLTADYEGPGQHAHSWAGCHGGGRVGVG